MSEHFTRPNVQPIITNIGTTPEQRQMSTSEFKAKFDEMPEAIQQYIKETLLAELDAFKEEFMTHQADNVHIFESGSNDDGYYTKFADGSLVWYKSIGLYNISIEAGAYATIVFSPPVPTTNILGLVGGATTSSDGSFRNGTIQTRAISTTELRLHISNLSSSPIAQIRNFAIGGIGRW